MPDEPLEDLMESTMGEAFDAATTEPSEEPAEDPGPARGADGRFVSTKESPDVPEGEAVDEGEEPAPEVAEEETPEEPKAEDVPQEAVELPEGFTDAEKEALQKAPEAAKAAARRIGDLQAQMTRTSQEAAEFRKRVEPLDQVVNPLRPGLQRAGVSDAEYIQRLIAADRISQSDPARLIKDLARHNNIDLSALAEGMANEPVPDPQLSALNQRLQRIEHGLTRQQRAALDQANTNANKQVEDFEHEKDESGNPKHPYFNEVFDDMVAEVKGLRAAHPEWPADKVLEKAYIRACEDSPTVSLKIKEAREKAEQAKKAAQAAKAAKEAKKSVVPSMGKGVRQRSDKPGSWEDTMSEAFDRAQSG